MNVFVLYCRCIYGVQPVKAVMSMVLLREMLKWLLLPCSYQKCQYANNTTNDLLDSGADLTNHSEPVRKILKFILRKECHSFFRPGNISYIMALKKKVIKKVIKIAIWWQTPEQSCSLIYLSQSLYTWRQTTS